MQKLFIAYPLICLAIFRTLLLQTTNEFIILGKTVTPFTFAIGTFSWTTYHFGVGRSSDGSGGGKDAGEESILEDISSGSGGGLLYYFRWMDSCRRVITDLEGRCQWSGEGDDDQQWAQHGSGVNARRWSVGAFVSSVSSHPLHHLYSLVGFPRIFDVVGALCCTYSYNTITS